MVLHGEAFAGEYEPVTMALVPLRNLGKVQVSASDLTGPARRSPRPRSISVMFRIASAASRWKEPSTRSPRG